MAVEGIIVNGVTGILKKLSSVVANEITLVWDFNDELKNLLITLHMILAVMEDAENKQVNSEPVRCWMENLKSIAYDAENILDDYSYEIISKHTQTEKVRKPSLYFRWRMAHKIKEINKNFNTIGKRKNDLGLQIIDVGSSSSHTVMENRETYSLVPANREIVGRENDQSKIINTLLDKDSCFVLSIVGLGGLGKTTMAQLVYNNEIVKKHFQLKIWICVSDPFDVKKLLKNIVNSTSTGEKYNDAATMDDIVHGLQDALREKKFLLVLDDVWNENFEDWHKLKTPLMVGAEGSKILVTTRSVNVAELMEDKFPHYELGILNDKDSLSLFKEIAFGFAAGAVETAELMEIGEEMVKRCGGLPLAVIFLGSLMRSRKKEEEWKNIRDTRIWHESHKGIKSRNIILPSLKLSYDFLPFYLKQCFSYCCIFPKDYIIEKKTLIRLWMAEGFLIETPGENTMSMEEIGNEYFHNLLCNFFFQDVKRNENGEIIACKMHDLVHDLASSVVGKNECLIVENADDIGCISERTFHLNLVNVNDNMLPKVFQVLKKAKNLRSVFLKCDVILFDIGKVFNKNKRLRVLDLHGSSIINLPSSIGELKHLRYLHLPADFIIPEGIGGLRFLQTLNEFNLDYEYKKNAGRNGIEGLECLNLLTGDLNIANLENVTSGIAACRANLKEKKNVRSLNLTWTNWHLRLLNPSFADMLNPSRAYLNAEKNLRGLNHAINNNHEVVLEGLRPHPNLRTLELSHFQGAKLPSWIEDSSCLPNLMELRLSGGIYIEQLAGFGALPSLRSLRIWGMEKLECIGNEFYYSIAAGVSSISSAGGGGGGESNNSGETARTTTTTTTTIAFPSLNKLTLEDLYSWKEWVVPPQASTTTGATTANCFPLLEDIAIRACPHLTTITPTTIVFPSLKVLNLQVMDGRAAETLVTNNLNYSLTSLTLSDIPNLISLPRQGLMENNNTLLSLTIINCSEFEGFLPPNNDERGGGGDQAKVSGSSLQSLKLLRCSVLRLFPDICSLTSLRRLSIVHCKELKSLPPMNVLTCLSSSLVQLQSVMIQKTGEVEEFKWNKESS